MIYCPNVPDNAESWQVFESDDQIKKKLENAEMFLGTYFEGSETECKEFSPDPGINPRDDMIQLKGNKIPKGLVSLEHLFSRRDEYVKGKLSCVPDKAEDYEKINIGDEADPKWVSIGRCCSSEEKNKLIKLLIKYKDVFAWCYDDLKNFRHGQFQHHIPLKPNAAPFRQKLRNYNPKVAEAIFREIDKMLKARIIYPIHHSTWVANIVLV